MAQAHSLSPSTEGKWEERKLNTPLGHAAIFRRLLT